MNKSNIRSRSPGLRTGTSLSSLSSGSLNDEHPSLICESNDRNRNIKNIRLDNKYFRRKLNRTRNIEYDRSDFKYSKRKEKTEERDGINKNNGELYSTNPYTNIISVTNKFENKETRTEDSMKDPSICNFQSGFLPSDVDYLIKDDLKVPKERKNVNNDTNIRLERLEKLVESLVNSRFSTSQTNLQGNTPSTTNAFELIPRNSNFTTSMWLNKIDDECIQRNFDEETSINFMHSKMCGVIKAWFKTLSVYDFTWVELKMLIIKMFPDNVDFATTLKLLVNRHIQPDETITNYFYSKMYLLEACKISGENAVSCLLDGLQSQKYREEGKSYNFLTPEALYSEFLSKLPEYIFQHDHFQISEQDIPNYEETYITEDYETATLPDNSNVFKHKFKKCFTCNKFGHLDIDCRHAPICYNCKRTGHIALNCSLKN